VSTLITGGRIITAADDYVGDVYVEDGRISGGFSRAPKRSTIESGGVLVVFYHPRLEEVRQRVIDLGGRVTADIFSFPGGRRFHFAEPSGNECAIWSEDPGAKEERS